MKMKTKKMVLCTSQVNKKAISRTQINGVEHIAVSSYTLPDDIVMNDVLYPSDEIEKSYLSLERTLAPVEHPTDDHGNYISAADPTAIHNFHAGAFNVNVSRENGRVHIEKHINVQEALKTDRGKRLLDRINELETNDNPRPIHTSVGLFMLVEELDKPMTNNHGDQYSKIGRDFVFDHDAILLDSVAAAPPEKGVGIAVNSAGEKMKVERIMIDNAVKASTGLPLAPSGRTWSKGSALRRVKAHIGATDAPNATYARYHLWYDSENSENFGAYKLPFVDIVDGTPKAVPSALRNAAARLSQTQGPSDAEKTRIKSIIDGYLSKLKTNADGSSGASFTQITEQLHQQLKGIVAADWLFIYDIFIDDMNLIFETPQGYFSVPFTMNDGKATIAGIPIRVDINIEFTPKINSQKGDDQMKELILNALTEAKITTEGLNDEQLLEAYQKLLKANAGDQETPPDVPPDDGDAITKAVNAAVKPITEAIANLTQQVNASTDAERDAMVKTVIDSKKYPGIDETAAKLLPVETLKAMAANCGTSFGVPISNNADSLDTTYSAPAEMPK